MDNLKKLKMGKEKYVKPKIESTDVEIGVYGNSYCEQIPTPPSCTR